MKPLVSVITPTWLRHDWLLHRCMPSVQGQTYPHIEHIIVSDGPDPELAVLMKDLQRLAPVLAGTETNRRKESRTLAKQVPTSVALVFAVAR